MTYIGAGKLKSILAANDNHQDVIIWGRRFKNIRMANLKSIKNNKVIYLNTIDLHSIDGIYLKIQFLLTFYKIEKMLMSIILRLLSSKYYCVHLPMIVDSRAWERLTHHNGEKVSGLTYMGVVDLLEYVVKNNVKIIRSREINIIIKNNVFDNSEILVTPSLSLEVIKNLKSC